MQKTEAAMILAGVKPEEQRQASAPTNLHVITGTVSGKSTSGKTQVLIDGLVFTSDDNQYIEIDTLGGLEEGDTATILLTGENGRGMTPLAVGAPGSIDRIDVRITSIEADYVKATVLDAEIARLGYVTADTVEATYATIDSLNAEKARISSLETNSATVENLEAAEARIHNLEVDHVTIDDFEAEQAKITNLQSATADISTIRANSAKVNDLTAEQLTAATGYIGDLQTANITTQDISAASGYVRDLNASNVLASNVIAAAGYIQDLESDNITAQDIIADHATVDTLDATYATISSLNAEKARIGAIEADYLQAADMTAEQARVGELLAGKASVSDLNAATGRIANLEAADVSITGRLDATEAVIDDLDATYLHTDLLNADVAWIQNGTIKDGAIVNGMIQSVSANKLTAGTIDASNITVTNLNADNITTGTINGQRIGAGSLSLDKLEEDVYTETEVDDIIAGLQTQIDGAIETWTGTDIPTLQNSPAVNWTTNVLKDAHVGDVYFVVNSNSQQNGYNYRFTKSGNTYSWQLIKDSDITNALARLSTAEGKITTFDSDISTLKTDTGTLKTKTTSLETRMSDAESDILDKVDITTFNEVSDTVDGHSQTITQMSQTLSNKADSSTVTAVTQRVSKTEQDISGITETLGELSDIVETKADGSTVTTISNRLNTVSNTVDGHTQTLTNVTQTVTQANQKSDTALQTALDVESRVSTAETSITQNRNNIALKANASDVYTKTQTDGLISTEVTNRNSAIEQSAAAINLSVSETYAAKAELGMRNLVDINSLTNGYITSTGTMNNPQATNNEVTSDYISVTPSDQLSYQYWVTAVGTYANVGAGWMAYAFFDSNKVFLTNPGRPSKYSGLSSAPAPYHGTYKLIVPADAAYIRVSWRKVNDGIVKLERYSDADALIDEKINTAKSEIKVTTDGISSTVSKISSIKYVTAVAASWPLASIKTYATEGHSENWGVNSTDGLRVGDTVYVKGTDGTRNCTVYIKTTVTAISSSTIFTGVSHGYEDVLPVDTIKSTINQSSDSVKIQAKHVEIDGAAIFSNTAFRQAADNAYDAKGTATNAINNLEIGGRNLLRNSKKPIPSTEPFNHSVVTIYNSTLDGIDYYYCSGSAYWRVDFPTLTTGETYNLWFDIARSSDARDVFIKIGDVETNVGSAKARIWSRLGTSFIASTATYAEIRVAFDSASNTSSYIAALKCIKLEKGTKPTDWTPAPEDTDSAILSVEESIPTKVSDLTNDSGFATTGQVDTAKSQAIAASYANMGFQFKKDIIIYGDSDKYYPVYLNNNQAEYSQSVPHEVVVTRGYSEQAPADWNTSTHKGGLNLRLRWNYGGWGGATYVCQIYDFSELYSKMLGDVLVGNKSGMNSTIYLRGGGTTGAIYHIYSQVSIENTRYGATFPYIGTTEPGTVYMQSGSYTFTVDNPLTTPNTAHILSLAATVDEQYIYISKASGTTSVASTTTWVTAYTDSQNAWTTKRPTYNSSYPVLFVAKQRKTAFGLVTCTTPVKDDTTTVIDGGHITTGTIDTNRLNADTIRSNIVQTTDIQASRVMMMSGEQTQSLEAYRESVSNNIGEMVSNETFQQKIQALDEALEEKLSQEDVNTLVNTAISDVEESIANNYVANADLDDAVQTLNDTLSNLGMTYATTEALSELSNSLNITSQDLIQLTSYIYADNIDDGEGGTVPVLFLGSKQSKVQAMLSNNVLNFIYRANPDDPGTVVAYIGAEETDTNATGKLYVIEAVVVNEISFGHWSFFERQNHNMAIKWIGE